MPLESISSVARPLDGARVSGAAPAPRAAAPAPEPKPEPKTEPKNASNGEPVERGVPQRLGAKQQLPPNTRLRIDEESNRIVAQILDENNEVVRQIPPEALLDLSSRFSQLEGLIFDQKT